MKIRNSIYFQNIFLFFMAIFSSYGLFVNVDLKSNAYGYEYTSQTDIIVISLVAILLFLFYKKGKKLVTEKSGLFIVLSMVFSSFMIIGYSYYKSNSSEYIFGSYLIIFMNSVKFIGLTFFFNRAIAYVYSIFKNRSFSLNTTPAKWQILIFEKRTFLFPLIIILLLWLPYIISYFPGIMSNDPANEIKQVMGLPNYNLTYAKSINPDAFITNHHTVFHTLLFGGLFKLGLSLGSANLGVFLFCFLQIVLLSCVLAYTIHYMSKIETPYWIRTCIMLLYGMCPIYTFMSLSPIKDVFYAALVVLYCVLLFDIINNKENKLSVKKTIFLIALLLLIMMSRNNGLHLVILTFPFIFFICRNHWKKLVIIFLVPILLFQAYTNILFPALNIVEGSRREAFSIPFQQTARFVKFHADELSDEDIAAIDKILRYDDLAKRYKPRISDPVKTEFNNAATNEELMDYFKVWFKCFFKHPETYISATVNNTFAYYYPNSEKSYMYSDYNIILRDSCGYDYHYNSLSLPRDGLKFFGRTLKDVPIIGLTVNVGVYSWIMLLLAVYLLKAKKFRYLIPLAPLLVSLLICIASPVNGSVRYALPYMYATPVLFTMFIYAIKKTPEPSISNRKIK